MNVVKINDIFSEEEIALIKKSIDSVEIPVDENGKYLSSAENQGTGIDEHLGRIQIGSLSLTTAIKEKILKIVNETSGSKLELGHILYAEYSNQYGEPNLPVHFDGDQNVLVFDFQLEANVSWDLGVDLKKYSLEDNSALIFNANEYPHWRPRRTFKDGEYVKMLFARFFDPAVESDYSHLRYTINHQVFSDINSFRDSLKS